MSGYPGFPLGGSEPHAMPRFHLPLIEPDVQFSRIRLSDQNSGFRLVKPSPQFIQHALAQYLR